VHDWVFCNVSPIVHKHESIEGGQESHGLRVISIEFVGVDTFKSACFIFLIIFGKILKRKWVISSAARSTGRFVACCLGQLHPKRSKDIFVLWPTVFFLVFIARRVVEWCRGSFFLFPLNYLGGSYYSFFKWRSCWLGGSFNAGQWLRGFSTLFK